MAITAEEIQQQTFKVDRKGYCIDEVDVFLEHLAGEVDELNAENARLAAQVRELEAALEARREEPAEEVELSFTEEDVAQNARIAELERKLEERKMDDNAIAKALIVAQRSGDEVIAQAKSEAETMVEDAKAEAARILEKANNEKQRVLETITNLQTDRERVRGEYQDLLKGFISSASKKLADLGGDLDSSSFAPAERTAPAPKPREHVAAPIAYTTPTTSSKPLATPVPPKPSKSEKDLSGFGDADDAFAFDDVE